MSSSRRANQQFQQARSELQLGQYEKALHSLLKAVESDRNFAEAHQGLGDLYRQLKDFPTAIEHYQKVLDLKPELTTITWFGLGESLLLSGQYEEALIALRHYEKSVGASDQKTLKTSSKYIQDCLFSIAYFQQNPVTDSPRPQALNAEINTPDDEYFPKLTADGKTMIFTRKTHEQENFFQSHSQSPTQWETAELLVGEINSPHYNEGAHSISPDGNHLYFTGCNRPEGLGSCDIYVSRRIGDRWGSPKNLGAPINTSGWEAQPALSADGQTLYFVSNRQGGYGGYDLWSSQLESDGQWGTPVNLGPNINTAFDESAPFVHADDHTLYFASNGWRGFGDKDIFVSTKDSLGIWQTPVNMGFPINDHSEQSAWSISMNGIQAYYSSRTKGGKGGLDIYTIRLAPEDRPPHVAYLQGRVIDAENKQPITDALIQITELEHAKPPFGTHSDPQDGTFFSPMIFGHQYALHVQHPEYLFHSSRFSLQDSLNIHDAYELVIALSKIAIGQSEILENIFFAVGQYELLAESQTELIKLLDYLKRNPRLKIEIGGHTDPTGLESTNQLLSEQRAHAVRTFLVDGGIAPERIQAKGYASTRPVASNDTAEGRSRNRRTDFKIIGN